MPARRKISPRQMDILLEFAESNRDIALGRLTGGPLAHQATRQAWVSVAKKLNAIAEGFTKTPDQWRRYWIEFKAKIKSKAADSRRNASATGGGPNKLVPLTQAEERGLAIIGTVAVEGLPGVRLPLDIPTAEGSRPPVTSETVPASPSTALPLPNSLAPYPDTEPPMDVEFLEEEVPFPLGVQSPEPSSSKSLLPNTEPPAPATHIQSVDQPEVASPREERPPVHLTLPTQRSTSRRQKMRRDERVPRWAYDLEEKRIAAEERLASAMEAMVQLIREIRDDIRSHISGMNIYF
ncbi:uncharacterized protein LOC123658989 [Melitaea cinxia]|uniref:uncharacterized protein LOC123658989 n=1 Tax=Melitaea cinxia TaxID=113334 RepID=UPI001E272384|nr:uncharacterized protein LOC123658989 [Melitaea cinxia]